MFGIWQALNMFIILMIPIFITLSQNCHAQTERWVGVDTENVVKSNKVPGTKLLRLLWFSDERGVGG